MRTALFLSTVGLVALAGCASNSLGTLDIRSTPTRLASGERPVPERIAEARGQLALGNVALALEAFRKAGREDPHSIDALVGMAKCYDLMGRSELSRAKYEAALALAPRDADLLGQLAASLSRHGKLQEAAGIRREIAGLKSNKGALLTAILPPLSLEDQDPAANAVTVRLPPARPMLAQRPDSAQATGKMLRLERISPVEVALVTRAAAPDTATPRPREAATHAGPLDALRPASIEILNAARIERIAARTRDWLAKRGWSRAAIGNAEASQARSLILHPAAELGLARRLAFELGIDRLERASSRHVTIVLGRDANLLAARRSDVALASASAHHVAPTPGAALLAQARHAILAGRTEQARMMIGRAAILGADGADLGAVFADLAFANQDYEQAALLYEARLLVAPDDAAAIEGAGLARFHLGQGDAAEAHLSRLTQATGATWRSWNALGALADMRRDWDASETSYRQALWLAPGRGEIVNNIGWSLLLRGRWAEAVSALEQAIVLNPGLDRATRNLELARTAFDTRLPQRRSDESEAEWAATLNDAGVVARAQGNERKAVAAFTRAIEVRSLWFGRAANNLKLAERRD